MRSRTFEQRKEPLRCIRIEYSAEPAVLDDRLRPRRKVPKVSETYPIDPGRQAPFPAAPDQTADVEQNWCVFSHSIKLNGGEEGVPFSRSTSPVNANPGSSRLIRCGPML